MGSQEEYPRMNTLTQLLFLLSLLQYGSCLKCYVCDVIEGAGTCAETGKGNFTECPSDNNKGCFITETTKIGDLDKTYEMGCMDFTNEEEYACEEHFPEGTDYEIRSCNCHGDGCNKDLTTAAGPPLKCYTCESKDEKICGPDPPGVLTDCPFNLRKGCFLTKVTDKDGTVYARGCSEVAAPSRYKCDHITANGIDMQYCNCHGDGCNKGFDTAGSTTANSTTADSTTVATSVAVVLICLFGCML